MTSSRRIPAALLIWCSGFSACAPRPAVPRDQPNLGISDDSVSQRASISLREVRVQNVGSAAGEGVVSIAVVDSFGTTLMDFSLHDGAPIRVPAAGLGGAEGRVIRIPGVPAFEKLVDSLLSTEACFGLRAKIRTAGSDADESDNVKTREWRRWLPMAPSAMLKMTFSLAVPHRPAVARVRIEPLRVPAGAVVVYPQSGGGPLVPPGRHSREVHLVTPEQLPLGSVFAVRLTLTDSRTGKYCNSTSGPRYMTLFPPCSAATRPCYCVMVELRFK